MQAITSCWCLSRSREGNVGILDYSSHGQVGLGFGVEVFLGFGLRLGVWGASGPLLGNISYNIAIRAREKSPKKNVCPT